MWGVAQGVGNSDWRVFSGRKSIDYHVFGVLVAFPTSSAGGRFLRRPRQSKVVAFAHAHQGNAMVNDMEGHRADRGRQGLVSSCQKVASGSHNFDLLASTAANDRGKLGASVGTNL